jgi:hypothetical protein
MRVLEPLILPADVVIVPVATLPSELRDQIDFAAGDCAVTRPRGRMNSSIVGSETAALLEYFRSPSTIVDAVIAHSAASGLDPRATLEEAFVVLAGFVNDGLLMPPDSDLARPIETALLPGQTFAGFEVLAPAHVMIDSAVYLARSAHLQAVALKVARPAFATSMRAAFAREAAILASLDGSVTPRLLAHGESDGCPFLAMSWCAAADVYEAAAEARRLGGREGRSALLGLAEGVLAAYARLHAQGVVHGDVHPRNVLAGSDGAVTIVDFGLAGGLSSSDLVAPAQRGGLDLFAEPELAKARLDGLAPPAVSAGGEQYSVAALVYLLLTGAHTHAFSLEQGAMFRQLAEDPPLGFACHGVADLAAVECVLRRALAKAPGERFASVSELLAAFARAAAADLRRASGQSSSPARRASRPARLLLDEVLGRLAIPARDPRAGTLAAPTAPVQNGAAGLACALLRVARVRTDASLLGLADLWSERALLASHTSAGFRSEIVLQKVGERSLYHAAPGVHAVAALVAGARSDEASQQLALDAFIESIGAPCEQVDIAFGRAGHLLGCALLLEATAPPLDVDALLRVGRALRGSLVAELAEQPALAVCEQLDVLGAAHGWAGLLFALLRWAEATGTLPSSAVVERLSQLGALGQPVGRGMRWPYGVGQPPLDNQLGAGWCNGAAGYVPLWTLAHELTGEDEFARLALGAAWSAYEDTAGGGSLCCGLAGRAYALLNIYRHGGGDIWLARARDLADRAAIGVRTDIDRRDSLYNGEVGVAVLAADLEDPTNSCMPMYEGDRWPRPG